MSASADRGAAFLDAARFAANQTIPYEALDAYLNAEVSASIKSIGQYAMEVSALLSGKGLDGDCLPWKKTHSDFRFRRGEVTLWHGINGHGKSAVTTQVALWLALQDRRCCLASFEMPPARTIQRMFLQCVGNPEPGEGLFSDFMVHLSPRMYLFDKRGRVDQRYLFAAIRYCAKEKKISHFFIDSLMKVVPKQDDYDGQCDFVNALCDVAHETGVHVHLIHHNRKGENEDKVPSKFDAKGSGSITDQVDNVIAVWRNKKKETDQRKALELGNALNDENPDFLLICDKQRNGNWEGKWALWGDPKCWHFRETSKEMWMRGYQLPKAP